MTDLREYSKLLDDLKSKLTELTEVDMGFGEVVIGGCTKGKTDVPGLIFARMIGDPRPVETDCLDIYPADEEVHPLDRRSVIYFHNKAAIDQVINILNTIKQDYYPETE